MALSQQSRKVLGGKSTFENKVCGLQYVCVSVAFLLCILVKVHMSVGAGGF